MERRLARFLRRRGASPSEVAAAEREGWLTLLTLDRLLLPGRPRLTRAELDARSGMPAELAERVWRAMGFPDVPDDVPLFTDEAVRMLSLLSQRIERPVLGGRLADPEEVVHQVRAVSAGLARVAETLSDQIVEAVAGARNDGAADGEIAAAVVGQLDWPALARLHDFALRLLLRAALWRKLTVEDPTSMPVAVGFVDLVGYTALSQELDEEQLVQLVARFEALTADTIAAGGGRLVKTIGDEVMFVTSDPAAAARIALSLTEQAELDELLPRARAALAWGAVVNHEGDCFGPVVNLAARLVELARPGAVLVDEQFRAALGEDAGFACTRIRPRRVRDIGRVEMWVLRAEVEPTVGGATRGPA